MENKNVQVPWDDDELVTIDLTHTWTSTPTSLSIHRLSFSVFVYISGREKGHDQLFRTDHVVI